MVEGLELRVKCRESTVEVLPSRVQCRGSIVEGRGGLKQDCIGYSDRIWHEKRENTWASISLKGTFN